MPSSRAILIRRLPTRMLPCSSCIAGNSLCQPISFSITRRSESSETSRRMLAARSRSLIRVISSIGVRIVDLLAADGVGPRLAVLTIATQHNVHRLHESGQLLRVTAVVADDLDLTNLSRLLANQLSTDEIVCAQRSFDRVIVGSRVEVHGIIAVAICHEQPVNVLDVIVEGAIDLDLTMPVVEIARHRNPDALRPGDRS